MISYDKIHKKLYTHKVLNAVTFCFAMFFMLYAILICLVKVDQQNQYDTIYTQLLREAADFNSKVENEHNTLPEDNGQENETQLFFGAKEAVLAAWENYENYTTFELSSSSTVTSVAAGQQVNIVSSSTACKFEDGSFYNSLTKYELPGSNFGMTNATEYYYKDGNRYSRTTKNVTKSGSTLTANYTTNYLLDENPCCTHLPFYIINSSTIMRELFFEVKYHPITKKLQYYYASVELNPSTSTVDYKKIINEQGGLTDISFNSVIAHLILDPEGNIVTLRVEESYKGNAHVVINIPVTITGNMSYNMVSINQTPTVNEPNV